MNSFRPWRLVTALVCVLSLSGCPESAQDEAAFGDAGQGGIGADTAGRVADAGAPDAGLPDVGVPDADQPKPDTTIAPPDTAQPDTAQPDTTQPDTAQPDAGEPDVEQPGCGGAIICDDGDPCTKDSCVAGVCQTTQLADWHLCTAGKQCLAGQCAATVAASTQRLVLGQQSSFAITSDNQLWAWGKNDKAQLILGDKLIGAKGPSRPTRTLLNAVKNVSSGNGFTCALNTAGNLWCAGNNAYGQAGIGAATPTTVKQPTPVKTNLVFVDVVLGWSHACARRPSGKVYCWGIGNAGQLGDGQSKHRTAPVAVSSLSGATQLALGEAFSCALTTNGKVWCWGINGYHQLGDGTGGTSQSSATPVNTVKLPGPASQIAAGRQHACAIVNINNGEVWCWGGNGAGQLGTGKTGSMGSPPVKVMGLSFEPTGLALGGDSSCAYKSGGEAACWGGNNFGQVDPTTSSQLVKSPKIRSDLAGLTGLAVGDGHLCALLPEKGLTRVKCAGNNYNGQLGAGDGFKTSKTLKVAENPAP